MLLSLNWFNFFSWQNKSTLEQSIIEKHKTGVLLCCDVFSSLAREAIHQILKVLIIQKLFSGSRKLRCWIPPFSHWFSHGFSHCCWTLPLPVSTLPIFSPFASLLFSPHLSCLPRQITSIIVFVLFWSTWKVLASLQVLQQHTASLLEHLLWMALNWFMAVPVNMKLVC